MGIPGMAHKEHHKCAEWQTSVAPLDVTCSWLTCMITKNAICMIRCCMDGDNLECGVGNPIIWMTGMFLQLLTLGSK